MLRRVVAATLGPLQVAGIKSFTVWRVRVDKRKTVMRRMRAVLSKSPTLLLRVRVVCMHATIRSYVQITRRHSLSRIATRMYGISRHAVVSNTNIRHDSLVSRRGRFRLWYPCRNVLVHSTLSHSHESFLCGAITRYFENVAIMLSGRLLYVRSATAFNNWL